MTTFAMTAEHLARTMEAARSRLRKQIAQRLEDQADLVLGGSLNGTSGDDLLHPTAVAEMLRSLAEDVRGGTVAQTPISVRDGGGKGEVHGTPGTSADPLLRDIDAEVAAEERDLMDGVLPPVVHHDDVAEGEHMAVMLARRGKLDFNRSTDPIPRD